MAGPKLITTIWHSGTHSLARVLDAYGVDDTWVHCGEQALTMAKSGDYDVYTTTRDPLMILASWINRDHPLKEKNWVETWKDQWLYYFLIKPYAKIYNTEKLPVIENKIPRDGCFKQWSEENNLQEWRKFLPEFDELMTAAGGLWSR